MMDKRNRHGAVGKSSSEQIRRQYVYLYCVKFLEPYTQCNRVLRQAGWLADEIQVNFEIFKVGCRSKYSTCRFV